MCAHHILTALITAVRRRTGLLAALRQALGYLLANARRANPRRERRSGHLRAGLVVVGTG